jgi:hypothetical protein
MAVLNAGISMMAMSEISWLIRVEALGHFGSSAMAGVFRRVLGLRIKLAKKGLDLVFGPYGLDNQGFLRCWQLLLCSHDRYDANTKSSHWQHYFGSGVAARSSYQNASQQS